MTGHGLETQSSRGRLLNVASRLIRTKLFGTVASLYLSQFAFFVLPAITIPYLARALGPAAWGTVAFAQSFGALLNILVEYGFNFSATRLTAANRDNREALSEILASTQGAKLILAAVAAGIAILAKTCIPGFSSSLVFYGAIFWSISSALNLNWYFLGVEKLPSVIGIELSFRVLAACGLFAFVRSPRDAWRVLFIQGCASFLVASTYLFIAGRQVHLRLPRWTEILSALREGRSAMIFRGTESIYTQGSSMLLGMMCGVSAVGIFAGAEKICRGVMLPLMDPIQRSLYAEVSSVVDKSLTKAADIVRTSAFWSLLIATAMSALVFWKAELVIRIVLGSKFRDAAPILRLMCVIPPATAFKWSVGLHWMMVTGKAKQFSQIIFGSAVLYMLLVLWLVPSHAGAGMATAVVFVELAIPLAAYLVVRLSGVDPFFQSQSSHPLVSVLVDTQ